MEYIQLAPLLPSFSRWRSLQSRFGGDSILRALEYETLVTKPPVGRVLDVGGGRNARYIKHLPPDIDIESINIDPGINPTYRINPGEPFPMDANIYDSAICLNTLEHIYDARTVLGETYRVLKPGGFVLITVPFLFRIHSHPDDFFRGTPSWWRETIAQVGFRKLELLPLVWGRSTTVGLIAGYRGLWPYLSRQLDLLKDIGYARLLCRGDSYDGTRGQRIIAISPGWFMIATR